MNYDNWKLQTPPRFLEEDEAYQDCILCGDPVLIDELDEDMICIDCLKLKEEYKHEY